MSDMFRFSTAHQEFFEQHGQMVQYRKRQLLVRSDEVSPWVFFVATGLVKAGFMTADASERIVCFFLPGMGFAQAGALVGKTVQGLEYEALGEVSAWRVPVSIFQQHLHENPALMRDFFQQVLESNLIMVERVMYSGEKDVRSRLARWLCTMSRHYGCDKPDGDFIDIPLTYDQIGSLTNTTRETCSKVLRDFSLQGLISVKQKRITIHGRAALEAMF